jgi:dual specificity tyrosine-phosphorylation-regulated kinase 2/3/4
MSSSSASSSLDPYYFSIPSPSEPTTFIPALPDALNDTPRTYRTSSSKRSSILDPTTPARDPASIDRRVLVGVGELATPRWATGPRDWRDDSRSVSPVDPNPPTGEDATLPRRPNGLGGHPDTDDEPIVRPSFCLHESYKRD